MKRMRQRTIAFLLATAMLTPNVSYALNNGLLVTAQNLSNVYQSDSTNWSDSQRNSINMLNYITFLTQQVNESKGNQLLLEEMYSSLKNDMYPNAVTDDTQTAINTLLDKIAKYRMISVKKQRLEYIYAQERAKAVRQAMTDPLTLLSLVQSKSVLKGVVSALYMVADSALKLENMTSQADMQYVQDGWELEDEEFDLLHQSTLEHLNYMFNMVQKYDLEGDYVLNEEAVKEFVKRVDGNNLISKITWLESHQKTYQQFGAYWLELVKCYYDTGNYQKCLDSVSEYEAISTRLFRKDVDYAMVLPMVILSASETMSEWAYITSAKKYTALIVDNTKDEDWSLRYFAAQIYLDLYAKTQNSEYLDSAYELALNNVNVLVQAQQKLNQSYLGELKLVKAGKEATKLEKKETKEYNKALKAERKIALPPVSEPLYLNCELLFALAEQKQISSEEQAKIDGILHNKANADDAGEPIFLSVVLDNRFRFAKNGAKVDVDKIDVTFDGDRLSIPATYLTDRCAITVSITGADGSTEITDWSVTEVERPKNADYSEFIATFTSESAEKYQYQDGDKITITVIPVVDSSERTMKFTYQAVGQKKFLIRNVIDFVRSTK